MRVSVGLPVLKAASDNPAGQASVGWGTPGCEAPWASWAFLWSGRNESESTTGALLCQGRLRGIPSGGDGDPAQSPSRRHERKERATRKAITRISSSVTASVDP